LQLAVASNDFIVKPNDRRNFILQLVDLQERFHRMFR
jgi:hypothetical protein